MSKGRMNRTYTLKQIHGLFAIEIACLPESDDLFLSNIPASEYSEYFQ
jgi:hypothetical protein